MFYDNILPIKGSYYRSRNKMSWDIVALSPKQIEKVLEYISLTRDENIPDENTPQEEFVEKTLYYLQIIEAFDNDPKKAAFHRNKAREMAEEAMDKVYSLMLAHIPKPTKYHFYTFFDTLEEAEAFKNKVGEEAEKAYEEVMEREFYNKLEENYYKWSVPPVLH